MNIYSKIHGTTADRFRIGTKNQRITLVGETTSESSVQLAGREIATFTASSTLFFTAYIIGQGTTTIAAYEIKGCYTNSSINSPGNVVVTFINTNNLNDPIVSFNENKEFSIVCPGAENETVSWTAIVDFVIV